MTFSLVGINTSTETGSVGTGTVAWPTTVAGDFAVYFWIYLTGSTPTDPSGFTFQQAQANSAGSGTTRFVTKICDGTESGNAVCSSTGADKIAAVLAVYRGTHRTSPLNATNVLNGGTTGTSLPSPSATSTTAGVMAVTVFSSRITTGPVSLTQSSPFTREALRAPYTGGGSTAIALADNLTPYGASGTSVTPPNWVSDFSFTTNAYNIWTVLLAPPPAMAIEIGGRQQAVNRAATY